MEESLSGTLAIDLGNTNTVVAFQDQKDINSVLLEIPNITSSPGVIPTAVWLEESSKIPKIGISALKMRDNSNSDLFFETVKLIVKYILIVKNLFLMNISNNAGIDSNDLAKRGESLIRKSTNRYLTTVKIAFRAKQRRFDDFDGLLEESTVKPVQRSIIELSDEQDQPDLLPG